MKTIREITGWRWLGQERYACLHCGRAVRIVASDPLPVRCACGGKHGGDKPRRSLVERSAGYAAAITRQLASGEPLLSAEAIGRRLAICRACPHYDPRGACRLCGCACRGRRSWRDKLAFGTARCPDKPPRWIEEKSTD